MAGSSTINVDKLKHHEQQQLCRTRPPYRQGKKLTAVKVYTVNNESQHLLITGVPKINLIQELMRIAMPYGDIKELVLIPDYPSEEFTETYHVCYKRIQSARIAKRFLDTKNFFGGILHVFYAPELESLAETRKKLIQRRRDVLTRIKRHKEEAANLTSELFEPKEQYNRQKRHPALPLTAERLSKQYPEESIDSIYDGIPRNIDPRPVSEPSLPKNSTEFNLQAENSSSTIFSTSQNNSIADENCREEEEEASSSSKLKGKSLKRKNYKGKTLNDREVVKVKVVRPHLVDTKKLLNFESTSEDRKTFSAVKKVDKGIVIKLLPKVEDNKKRIVIKNSSVTQLVQPSESLQASISSVKNSIREAMQRK